MGTLLLLFLILILAALAGAMVTIALVQSRRPPRQLPPPAGPNAPAWQQQVGPSATQFPVYNPINYLSPGDRERILVLLRGGKKIHAIKLYREVTGAGLREAKEAVEHLDRFQ